MLDVYAIGVVARFEAKLLFRSWAFRIFSLFGLAILFFMDVGIGTTIGRASYYMRALSGSLPLMNLKLLNIYQGIIVAFLATEFIKRDHRHDTSQVVFARSFSNVEYLLGKVMGILAVFFVLNLAALLPAVVIHVVFHSSVFAWQPYVIYTCAISIPTLIFMMGTSFLLVSLLRSQAVVFVVMLGYSLLVLILLGSRQYYVFDSYALYQPLVYSDLVGVGNWREILLVRGMYLFYGLGLMAVTVLLIKRLRQSPLNTVIAGAIAVVFLLSATAMGFVYLHGKYADRDRRRQFQSICTTARKIPTVTVEAYSIDLRHAGNELAAVAQIMAVNQTASPLDSVLFTLNPGLTVAAVTAAGRDIPFRREQQLLWLQPDGALAARDTLQLSISYSGVIDEQYCYLDVDEERRDASYRIWLYGMPKRYAFVQPGYVHLTPEAGWYPVPGLSPGAAFPEAVPYSYATYALTVGVPEGQTAIAQGIPDSIVNADVLLCRFRPEHRLPGVSLTVGEYELRRIVVDSIEYSLYTFPGHDYFLPFFEAIADTLPRLIRETKNEYDVALGLEYPYPRLSLVEVPIQFYTYRRLWTLAQETVQPQIVYLPELGTICAGTDFQRMKRMGTRRQERANQAESAAEIQARYFTTFAKTDLLGMQADRWSIRGEEDLEPRYEILPNYLSYATHLSSDRWPVLNYAVESYFQTRVAAVEEEDRWLRWRGLNDREKANQALHHYSLAELLAAQEVKTEIKSAALAAKGRHLLSYLAANAGAERFGMQLASFLNDRRFHDVADEELVELASTLGLPDPAAMIDTWYYDTLLAGYMIDNIENYEVIDDEHTRSQLRFDLTNSTAVTGVVRIDIRCRRQEMDFGPRGMDGRGQSDYIQTVLMPAQTTKKMGVVLDRPPAEMTVETFASQNIPAVFHIPFREQKLRRGELPFSGAETLPFDKNVAGRSDEYVVDNEDHGFTAAAMTQANWLRRMLLKMFDAENENERYQNVFFWDPPKDWVLTINQDFYGDFVHSGYCKQAGEGQSNVSWIAELAEPGDYEIHYYCESGLGALPGFPGGPGSREREEGRQNLGLKNFLVYHDDGVEELPVDLDGAEPGWNYLGTYRLAAGKNRIELNDKNETDYVTADAVKWIKR